MYSRDHCDSRYTHQRATKPWLGQPRREMAEAWRMRGETAFCERGGAPDAHSWGIRHDSVSVIKGLRKFRTQMASLPWRAPRHRRYCQCHL